MKRKIITSALLIMLIKVNAQFATFEDLSLPIDSFENGRNLNGSFTNGNILFLNQYTDWGGGFESFNGFAFSTMRDSLTPGYGNSFSSIKGSGNNGSQTYGIFYDNYQNAAMKFSVTSLPLGFYINNTAYSYYSMKDGDGFAKKFGGLTGDDPDYFKLYVYNYSNGSITDTVDFYLADYRFIDNSSDYIITKWTYLDLSSFGSSDSISFSFESTDVGTFGINTPSYFCMDDFSYDSFVNVKEMSKVFEFPIYPNPAEKYIVLNKETDHYLISDLSGNIILSGDSDNANVVNIENIKSGIYIVKQFKKSRVLSSQKLVKN